MRLTKSAKMPMHKEGAKGRKAYSCGQEAIRERNSWRLSSPAYL